MEGNQNLFFVWLTIILLSLIFFYGREILEELEEPIMFVLDKIWPLYFLLTALVFWSPIAVIGTFVYFILFTTKFIKLVYEFLPLLFVICLIIIFSHILSWVKRDEEEKFLVTGKVKEIIPIKNFFFPIVINPYSENVIEYSDLCIRYMVILETSNGDEISITFNTNLPNEVKIGKNINVICKSKSKDRYEYVY